MPVQSKKDMAALKGACLLVAVCVMMLHSSMAQQPPTATSPAAPTASTSPNMGQPPPPPPTLTSPSPPASPGCPYTGQQPSPWPTPVVPSPTPTPPTPMVPTPTPTAPTPVVPSPTPTPPTPMVPASTPAPAPAPVNNCNYSDCTSQCSPSCQASYAPRNCTSLVEGAFNGCYESCTSHTCPGKSCVHSGCGFGSCSCDNKYASSCCESCRTSVFPTIVGSDYRECQSYNERYMGYCMTYCYDRCSKNCTSTT